MTSLAAMARTVLTPLPEVTRMGSLRRSTVLFSQGQRPDSLYLLEDGLIKLTRTSRSGSRIILCICGPDHIIGEEVLQDSAGVYYAEAEVLSEATVHRIPAGIVSNTFASNPELASAVTAAIIRQKRALAEKIEMLCLHDVEYRILYYLAELSHLVRPSDREGYQLPITQLELADLIGATRETTSTTLNQLERRGLVRLSRRLLTIPSPEELLSAASARFVPQNGNSKTDTVVATA